MCTNHSSFFFSFLFFFVFFFFFFISLSTLLSNTRLTCSSCTESVISSAVVCNQFGCCVIGEVFIFILFFSFHTQASQYFSLLGHCMFLVIAYRLACEHCASSLCVCVCFVLLSFCTFPESASAVCSLEQLYNICRTWPVTRNLIQSPSFRPSSCVA